MTIHNPSTYPIRGIFNLICHSTLWNQIAFGLLIMILATTVSTVFLFVFVFPIQSTALSVYMASWIGWIVSFILTLFEIGTSVLVISSIFLSYYTDIIFDAVGRQETMGIDVTPIERNLSTRFSCIKSFLILIIFRVFLLILTSPLNLIPILGTILYIYINGYYYAWSLHCRYFDLLDLTFLQTDFIQSLLISDEPLQVRTASLLADFIDLTPKIFLRTLTFIQNTTAQSLFLTGASVTSVFPRFQPSDDTNNIPSFDGITCTCSSATSTTCMSVATFENNIVAGFQTGCYMLSALLKSTFEIFYDQIYVNLLTESSDRFQKLNSSILINKTIEELLSQMFVIEWRNQTFFQQYFNSCAPDSCQYTNIQRHDFFYILSLH